jgi:diguanylate cyclase (GGDEF)-like protein
MTGTATRRGDAVLRQMRGRLQSVFRVSDYLVRWGGEEFLVVARETSRQRAPALAERLRAAVAEQDFVLDDGSHIGRTCSVGFACLPLDPQHAHAVDWHAVLRLADAALYRAKDSGRNAWAGVVAAQGESDAALQAWVRRPLQDWIDTGAVQIETGPGEKP